MRHSDTHSTAVSGSTWEFKAGQSGTSSLKNLYQVRSERSVEVHLIADSDTVSNSDRLTRATAGLRARSSNPCALSCRTLSSCRDNTCSSTCAVSTRRASWVLEYWRHVCARRSDAAFWHEVESIAKREPGARHRDRRRNSADLACLLGRSRRSHFHDGRWTQLPPAICLWIQLYGRRVLLSDTPVQQALSPAAGGDLNPKSSAEHTARRRLIFPIHKPPRITWATEREGTLDTTSSL